MQSTRSHLIDIFISGRSIIIISTIYTERSALSRALTQVVHVPTYAAIARRYSFVALGAPAIDTRDATSIFNRHLLCFLQPPNSSNLDIHIGFPNPKQNFFSSQPTFLLLGYSRSFNPTAFPYDSRSSHQQLWLQKKTVAPIARRTDIAIDMMTVSMASNIKGHGS